MLNNDMVQLSPALANLQASFRGKNSFLHIQRLHNMLYAYGATVIEVVRRKEFGKYALLLWGSITDYTCSSLLLSEGAKYTGGHGKALVSDIYCFKAGLSLQS